MQMINRKFPAAALLGICAMLFSFSSLPGADKFEIYLNNKLILEQYVSSTAGPKYLTLHRTNYNDKIDVFYNHCGHSGKNRTILLKDSDNKVIKKWEFADAATGNNNMSWKVKEIMDLQNGKDRSTLRLFYQSKEIPEGRLLATIVTGNSNYAHL
jgi:hypothetical protein